MGTKEKLIEKILHIEDESILESIIGVIDLELKSAGGTVYLTQEQKSFVDKDLRDIEEGYLVSNEEAKR